MSFRRRRPCVLVLLCAVVSAANAAADTYPRQPGVDAIHYVFRLTLDESDSEITGESTVFLRFVSNGVKEVFLDLASTAAGKGMSVSSVTSGGKPVEYAHQANRLRIPAPSAKSGDDVEYTIRYRGVPASGLRIDKNIHGDRTFFSENWPDKARQWLPTIDHPYDKASGEFIVTAPSRYQVVANGILVEEADVANGMRRTHWKQSVPIATWLYALGVARFAVHHYDVVRGIPQQVWVFPQDREKGYEVFEFTGRRAFDFFSEQIGPYAYEKLSHVEAAGMNGGMEHASAIFYGEKGVASGRAPVVHEVAHQWFGDAVTEKDWDDVWLSEGFATYFAHLYAERFDGRDAFVQGLKNDIPTILKEQAELPNQPVIHRNISKMDDVLNRFVYQKGGWVLHMLRGVVGTEKFWSGIREYYRRYKNLNASTDDFRQIMEQASGKELLWFFDQWLKQPGMPTVSGTWRYDAGSKTIEIELSQTQTGAAYRLPLDIGIQQAAGSPRIERIELDAKQGRFTIATPLEPSTVTLDPNTWVLMQSGELTRKP